MSTVSEIEAALRELPAHKARTVSRWLQKHLAQKQNGWRKAASTAKKPSKNNTLDQLVRAAARFPADLPADAAAQHDHYLYGLPKR